MKAIVIGLDGATWNILLPWAEKGKLPFLKKLISESSYGPLRTVFPSQTAVAWTAFQTGCNPGKSGVYDFFKVKDKKISQDFVGLDDVKMPSFWDIMARVNKKACVIGLPVCYPFPRTDGIFVAGLLTPPNVPFATPNEIYRVLKKLDYKVEVAFENFLDMPMDFDRKKVYDEILKITEKRCEALKTLSAEQWDLLFILFKELDVVQHFFWEKKELLDYWVFLDRKLEQLYRFLTDKFGEDLTFCFLSDHGFQKSPSYQVGVYKILSEINSVKDTKDKGIGNIFLSYSQRIYWWLQYRNIELTKINFLKRFSNLAVRSGKEGKIFDVSYYGISINKDLLPDGLNFNDLKKEIIKKLNMVSHKGRKVFLKVGSREDFYQGPEVKNAPDIIFIFNFDYLASLSPFTKEVIHKRPQKDIHNAGDHGSSLEGIFVINGENIKRKYKTKARIYDIIPTLMHILNVPITEDIDGKVLEDIFIDDKRKVSRSKKENVSSLIDHAFDALTKNDKN